MKPSERVKEIFDKFVQNHEYVGVKLEHAIINYLDEEYEKNKRWRCEHTNSYQVEGIDDIYYNVCNECGVLFLANEDTKNKVNSFGEPIVD